MIKRMLVMENKQRRMVFGTKAKMIHIHAIQLLTKLKARSDIEVASNNRMSRDLKAEVEGLKMELTNADAMKEEFKKVEKKLKKLEKKKKKAKKD